MTWGEMLTAVLEYHVNRGSSSVAKDIDLRKRANFFGTRVCKRVWDSAPHWWKLNSDTVALSSGVGTMPTDFSQAGPEAQLYVQSNKYWRVTYQPPYRVKWLTTNNPQNGLPRVWTLLDKTSLGIPKILCWPTDDSTLVVTNYVRKMPELIDIPLAPLIAAGAAGNPNGTYTGRVTFVTALGETEGGDVTASLSVTSQKIAWTDIQTWWGKTVTSRKLYRTAAGGTQHKLVTTLSDNTTTSYTDDVADGSLGADVPTNATAVTGLEVFPEQFHESAIFDGLVKFMARGGGDGREVIFDRDWDRSIKRLWEENQQGQNEVRAFPAFPGVTGGHPVWSHWSPPD